VKPVSQERRRLTIRPFSSRRHHHRLLFSLPEMGHPAGQVASPAGRRQAHQSVPRQAPQDRCRLDIWTFLLYLTTTTFLCHILVHARSLPDPSLSVVAFLLRSLNCLIDDAWSTPVTVKQQRASSISAGLLEVDKQPSVDEQAAAGRVPRQVRRKEDGRAGDVVRWSVSLASQDGPNQPELSR
jgi:hypothetical protein